MFIGPSLILVLIFNINYDTALVKCFFRLTDEGAHGKIEAMLFLHVYV